MPPIKRPEFRRLLLISITVALGFGMLIPVLPLYAEDFGVGLAAIGLVQTVFGFTRFSFGLVGGLAVDRFGERASTIAGLLIVSASSYAAGFATSFPQLVAARGFGGAGSALFIAGLMNRIIRIIEPEAMSRATGSFRSSFLVGIAVGPALGGVLSARFGLQAPFFFYATGLLLASVIAWFAMGRRVDVRKETRTPMDALRAARPLFSDFRYTLALVATFVGWWTISGPAQNLGPVFARGELGFSSQQIGFATTMLAAGELLVLLVSGRAADTHGRRAVLLPSMAVAAGATIALGQIEGAPWLYFPIMAALGGGIAASSVAAGGLLADAIPPGGSGAAVGVNQMAGDLGFLIAPTAIGYLAEQTTFATAYAAAAIPAAAVFVAALRAPSGVGRKRSLDVPLEPREHTH
ncbi:MAG: MFS transporter [Actinomycetota bacterium]